MRIIKQHTTEYKEFYKLLPYMSSKYGRKGTSVHPNVNEQTERKKNSGFFNEVIKFMENSGKKENHENIEQLLIKTIGSIIPVSDVALFYYKDSEYRLLSDSGHEKAVDIIQNAQKEGILDWIIEAKNCRTIPDLKTTRSSGTKTFLLIVPVHWGNDKKGIAAIETSAAYISETADETKMLQMLIQNAWLKFELIRQGKELAAAYNDQQIYQSKLINNHKLSAIGELTNGIAEEILSPLQVLMSHIDILKKEKSAVTEKESLKMKKQIKKIESVIIRLLKFASLHVNTFKLYPCDINQHINEYYSIISNNLAIHKYESHLDLSQSLPPVISHPNYINQILSNVFNIVNSTGGAGGGIIIQTRYIGEKISVRFVVSGISEFKESFREIYEVNIRIIDNIMKKHEGEFRIGSNKQQGIAIVLTFPLKRKIR